MISPTNCKNGCRLSDISYTPFISLGRCHNQIIEKRGKCSVKVCTNSIYGLSLIYGIMIRENILKLWTSYSGAFDMFTLGLYVSETNNVNNIYVSGRVVDL